MDVAVGQRQFDGNVAIVAQHAIDDRQYVQPAEYNRGRDFQGAARLGIFATDLSLGAIDVLQYLLAAFKIEFATLGQPQRSRGAQKQCQAELILKLRDRPVTTEGESCKRRAASVKLPSLATDTKIRMAPRRSMRLLLKQQ
jgi:hypothetical protein